MKLYKNRVLSPGMLRCPRCGGQYDPCVQSSWCREKLKHNPIKRTCEWQPPPPASADKPKRRAEPQSDFALIWDETQPNPRAPK